MWGTRFGLCPPPISLLPFFLFRSTDKSSFLTVTTTPVSKPSTQFPFVQLGFEFRARNRRVFLWQFGSQEYGYQGAKDQEVEKTYANRELLSTGFISSILVCALLFSVPRFYIIHLKSNYSSCTAKRIWSLRRCSTTLFELFTNHLFIYILRK